MRDQKNQNKKNTAADQPGPLNSEILNPATCIGSIEGVGIADAIAEAQVSGDFPTRSKPPKAHSEPPCLRVIPAGASPEEVEARLRQLRPKLRGQESVLPSNAPAAAVRIPYPDHAHSNPQVPRDTPSFRASAHGDENTTDRSYSVGDVITYRPIGQLQLRQGRIERIVEDTAFLDNGDRVDAFHVFERGLA